MSTHPEVSVFTHGSRRFLKAAIGLAYCWLWALSPSPSHASAPGDRAMRILSILPGTWSFTLGETSGTRVSTVLYPESVIEWSETFDGRDVEGKGFIGYDAKQDLFFSMTVHSGAGNYGFMTGRLAATEDKIVFEPANVESGTRPFKSIFQLTTTDRFTYTALVKGDDDGWTQRWVAIFERRD